VPQAKPLSAGEVLGCTAPKGLHLKAAATPGSAADGSDAAAAAAAAFPQHQCMLFVADGRFHLEAAMIANPLLPAYRYDPYSRALTEEGYDFGKMKELRLEAITSAQSAKTFGIVLGTLGRQGNPAILSKIKLLLAKHGKRSFIVLLSEIFPQKLDMMPDADAWVQIACPRLSVDWGHFFSKSVLSPYELNVALGEAEWTKDSYPMDFYEKGDNSWSNFGGDNNLRELIF
jgi:2-(3-amino-3-carboxypropyl)histidine synthase